MKLVKLSEICTFSRGLTYSKSDEVDFSNNVVLRANNIDLDSNSLNLDDLRYIKDSIQIKKEKIAKKNSLIICTASGSKSHVGKVALIDEDYGYAFGGFMGQLTPTYKCHPKFLYYIVTSGLFKDFLMSLNDGTNINNLKFSDIENYEILLPSLEKQKEIIEKLDSGFTEIDLLEDNLDLSEEKVNQLLQSLLSSAFTLKEASGDEINSSANKGVVMNTFKLGDVCQISKGKTITRATANEGKVPVIGGGLGPTYYHDKSNIEAPVITISASGANAGFVNYWGIPIWASDCTTIIELPDPPAIIGYIYKYLQSRQEFINSELRRGSAQPHVYPSDISDLEINLPPLDKQQEIVEKLDIAFAEIELLKAQIKVEKDYAVALRQSLLSNAFALEEAVT